MNRTEEARRHLDTLRRGTDDYMSVQRYLYRDLRKGGLSLVDIGTSEEELTELCVKGCRIRAKMWFNALRTGLGEPNAMVKLIRDDLRKGGLSLADIGTSEEELSTFLSNN